MTLFEITQAERTGWQQRAAGELAATLDTHPDLPITGWTLASAGSILVDHVSGPASTDQLRRTFDTWCETVLLSPPDAVSVSDGTVFLKATTHRNRAQVTVTATLAPHRDGEMTP